MKVMKVDEGSAEPYSKSVLRVGRRQQVLDRHGTIVRELVHGLIHVLVPEDEAFLVAQVVVHEANGATYFFRLSCLVIFSTAAQ